MVNQYRIVVINNSGVQQNYQLFNTPPKVTGGTSPQIWSNVFQNANYTQDGAVATFTMWTQYYGMVGTIRGSQQEGAEVQISQTKDVTLGDLEDNGTVIEGTTLTMAVAGGVQPYFVSDEQAAKDSGYANSFAVETRPTFDVLTAKSNNFMIGVAASSGTGAVTPMASFLPEPGCTYQVKPANKYFLTFGGPVPVGRLANVDKIGHKCTVDFATMPSTVTIRHTPKGSLVVQASNGSVFP